MFGLDPTTISIITSVLALLFGIYYIRVRMERAHHQVDQKIRKKTKSSEDISLELKRIEKELDAGVQEDRAPKEKVSARVLELRPKEKLVSLEEALKGTKSGFMSKLQSIFAEKQELATEDLTSIEELLYTSDLGPQAVQKLFESLSEKLKVSQHKNLSFICESLRDEMQKILIEAKPIRSLDSFFSAEYISKNKPEVWMIVGVNGAGKTTTTGKLAHKLAQANKKVLVAAGDTFRAAAGEQLRVWSERAQVEIFAPEGVDSPSAVAFDACKMAQQKGFDILLIDTAGRLHTQKNLMDELKKVRRVIEKSQIGAPHEVLLVLDANNGQNALVQAREFHATLNVTSVILTKLDGTAKGGVAIGVASELLLPIQLIGVGEKIDDLRTFSPKDFVNAII